MKEPMQFGGPESVGKPFELFANFFSKLGSKAAELGKREQAFRDTINLHREMEKVTTAEIGKRLKSVGQMHESMAPIAESTETKLEPQGGLSTKARYRAAQPKKADNKDENVKKQPKNSKAKKAAATKDISSTSGKPKNTATKVMPKVNKAQQEINETA